MAEGGHIYPQGRYKQNGLFTGGPDFKLNACVGKNGGPYNLHAYATGYFHGARRIAESLIESQHYVDLVVYTLVYCYRHAIELEIKHLCELVPQALGAQGSLGRSLKFTHKITDNWSVLKELIEGHPGFDKDGERVKLVDRVIRDLVEIDPSGEAFRYPEARDRSRFLQETSLINVRVLGETLEPVEEAFHEWDFVANAMME